MAKINILTDNLESTEFLKIKNFLISHGIDFGSIVITEELENLIRPDSLTPENRGLLIQQFQEAFSRLSLLKGFRADVVCFYPELHDLNFIISKFGSIHYHFENEYWYFVDGEARFGFLGEGGVKFEVQVEKGEYLKVPEGTWQWFSLTPKQKMKAVRFFYTDQKVPQRQPITTL